MSRLGWVGSRDNLIENDPGRDKIDRLEILIMIFCSIEVQFCSIGVPEKPKQWMPSDRFLAILRGNLSIGRCKHYRIRCMQATLTGQYESYLPYVETCQIRVSPPPKKSPQTNFQNLSFCHHATHAQNIPVCVFNNCTRGFPLGP